MLSKKNRKKLIINADDFGRNEANIQAIVSAFREGIVSSTSVFCTSPFFNHAADVLREMPELRPGVHLDFSFGNPVNQSNKNSSLINPYSGGFWPVSEIPKLLMEGKISTSDLAIEFEAQINAMIDAGIKPSHLDNHRPEIYFFPDHFSVVIELANRYQLPIRFPFCDHKETMQLLSKRVNTSEAQIFKLKDKFIELINTQSFVSPSGFFMLPHPTDDENLKPIASCISNSPQTVFEICCHVDTDLRGLHDISLLQSEEWRNFLRDSNIDLVSFEYLKGHML